MITEEDFKINSVNSDMDMMLDSASQMCNDLRGSLELLHDLLAEEKPTGRPDMETLRAMMGTLAGIAQLVCLKIDYATEINARRAAA